MLTNRQHSTLVIVGSARTPGKKESPASYGRASSNNNTQSSAESSFPMNGAGCLDLHVDYITLLRQGLFIF